jgi:hypothetical protein
MSPKTKFLADILAPANPYSQFTGLSADLSTWRDGAICEKWPFTLRPGWGLIVDKTNKSSGRRLSDFLSYNLFVAVSTEGRNFFTVVLLP